LFTGLGGIHAEMSYIIVRHKEGCWMFVEKMSVSSGAFGWTPAPTMWNLPAFELVGRFHASTSCPREILDLMKRMGLFG
jgi:hypothetical protein